MKRSFLASLLAGAMLAASIGSATAATISWSDSVPVTLTDWSDNFTGSKFDSTLGTLQSVGIYLYGDVLGYVQFTNNTATNKTYREVRLGTDVTVTLPVQGDVTVSSSDAHTYLSPYIPVPSNSTVTSEILYGFNSTNELYTDLLTLAAFTGSGNIIIPVSSLGYAGYTGSSNMQVDPYADSLANITVTYTYESTPVPEPSTLILVGLGVAGAAILARKKKQA